jgi:hypothetical protein
MPEQNFHTKVVSMTGRLGGIYPHELLCGGASSLYKRGIREGLVNRENYHMAKEHYQMQWNVDNHIKIK